jgi:hypothetical protein
LSLSLFLSLSFFFFFCRSQKNFICREFSWWKEKRKTAYWRMQGDPDTGDPSLSFLIEFKLQEDKNLFPVWYSLNVISSRCSIHIFNAW